MIRFVCAFKLCKIGDVFSLMYIREKIITIIILLHEMKFANHILGDGIKLSGSLPQGNTANATSHYDNDEDGENTTSKLTSCTCTV